MIELVPQVCFVLLGLILGRAYFRRSMFCKGSMLVAASFFPLLYSSFYPSSAIDYELQVKYWWITVSILWGSGLAMVFLTAVVPVKRKYMNWYAALASCVLFVVCFCLPLYSPHQGWDMHHHFIWESPFHFH